MKIVVIGPVYPYRGGIAHYTTQLSSKLITSGFDTYNFSFRRQYPAWLYPGKSDKDPSKRVIQLETKYTLDPLYPWTWTKTVNEIIKINPDAVLIQWWTTFWAPAFWSVAKLLSRKGYKVIFLIHNVTPHEHKPWDNWFARKVLQLGDAHIVQAKNEEQRLLAILPGIKPVLCPHPVYNQFIIDSDQNSEAEKHLQRLDQDLPVLLFFGIVRPYKGLPFLIEALAILKSAGILVQLIIAGEFWEKIEPYEEMIVQLDLYDQVFIFDRYIPDEEVGLFFNAANIFIAPYIDGTQSGSVKIALAFNLPIVVTECIADDLLESSDRVLIIPAEDSQALASAIHELIDAGFPESKIINQEDTSWSQLISTIEGLIS